jgi:hypothetical protein
MLAVWWSRTETTNASVAVQLETTQVQKLRGAVIAKMANTDAVLIGEATTYGDDDHSELTFLVAPTRINDAISAVAESGGKVVAQQIDIRQNTETATDFGASVSSLQECLAKAATAARSGALDNVTKAVSACQDQATAVSGSLTTTATPLSNVELTVQIDRGGAGSVAATAILFIAALGLVIACIAAVRASRSRQVFDLTDSPLAATDLHARRN